MIPVEVAELSSSCPSLSLLLTCTHSVRLVLLSEFSVWVPAVCISGPLLLLMFAFRQDEASCDLFHCGSLCELLLGSSGQWHEK